MVYIRRSAQVQAIQYTGDNIDDILGFAQNAKRNKWKDGYLEVECETGDLWLLPGDYILLDEEGKYTKMSEKEFLHNFEPKLSRIC